MEVRCRTSVSGLPKVEGYLEKRGRFNLKCMWKKYWFVLDGRSLLYFKSKDSYETLGVCKGMIDFSRVHIIRVPVKIHHGYPFEIVTRSQVIYLSAGDSKTRDIWIEELQHAVRPPQVSDPYDTSKITAPHLSSLFEKVCTNPSGITKQDCNQKELSAMSSLETTATPTTRSSDTKKLSINKNDTVELSDGNVETESVSSLTKSDLAENEENTLLQPRNSVFETSSDDHSIITCLENKKNSKPNTNSILSNINLLETQDENNDKNNDELLEPQTENDSDETDENNEESNYETAEETLENENEIINKTEIKRNSYKLPHPILPNNDLSVYYELKNFIQDLNHKNPSPSVNRLGKSVAVETMRNFLVEIES